MIASHKIRAEIDRLEFIVHELDGGSCSDTLLERLGDVGATLCEMADGHYAQSLMFPDGVLTHASQGESESPLRDPQKPPSVPVAS